MQSSKLHYENLFLKIGEKMRLGILVVYLVSTEDEKLLDIHLNQIHKNTKADYKIYANVNMLLPKFIQKLENNSNVKICKSNDYVGPNDGLRSTHELAFYAEKLIKESIKDGVSHVVIMHPDSFPIKVGWEKILAKYISKSTVMVSKLPEMSACFFFNRSFYLKYNPQLISTKVEIKSSIYKQFLKDIGGIDLLEPGMGYAFLIYKKKLQWKSLNRSNKGEDHYFYGSIFEDLIFHLGAASHENRGFYNYEEKRTKYHKIKVIGKFLPPVIKERIKTSILQSFIRPEIKVHQQSYLTVRKRLYADSDSYIEFLRNGSEK